MHRFEAITQQPQRMSSAPASLSSLKAHLRTRFLHQRSSQNYADELTNIDKIVPRNVAQTESDTGLSEPQSLSPRNCLTVNLLRVRLFYGN